MLFLFKYIDDLIGKGFEWYVIVELFWYASATNIAMALPLSMLLSSIMTFGNLGESYELVAVKASGISLRKAMTPLFILVGMFSVGSFFFSDYIMPVANLKMGSLLWDVRNKKADFLIKPGIFNNTIPGYSIRAKGKNKDGTVLYDLMIYDHKGGNPGNNVILAKEGYIHNSADNNYMILQLKDGIRYEESTVKGANRYDPRRQFIRFRFEETETKFDMGTFQMKRTDENLFKSLHQMLNLSQLKHYTDSNRRTIDSVGRMAFDETKYYFHYFSNYYKQGEYANSVPQDQVKDVTDYLDDRNQRMAVSNALGQSQQILDVLRAKKLEYKGYIDKDIRYNLEYHRKFTLAVSCLLLFGIGAPLGAIIRKGGLGLPVVMAIFFFLIYHIIATLAEKAAKDGSLEPLPGMWMAIIVLTPLAIFLTYKSTTDSSLFDAEQYKLRLEALWKWVRKNILFKKEKSQ